MKFKYFLIFILLNSCATNKIVQETDVVEINFGSGGGFTGEVKTFKLTSNGKLFENGTEVNTLKINTTLNYFKKAKKFIDFDLKNPENMYSFLEIKTINKTNRIVWSYASTTIDKRVVEFYNELITNTK